MSKYILDQKVEILLDGIWHPALIKADNAGPKNQYTVVSPPTGGRFHKTAVDESRLRVPSAPETAVEPVEAPVVPEETKVTAPVEEEVTETPIAFTTIPVSDDSDTIASVS